MKYPLTVIFASLSLFIFATVNHFGKLPAATLTNYGFSASAPWNEWFYRTITSDWIYSNPFHFWTCVIPIIFFLIWAERTHSIRFLICFLLAVSFLDDFVDFFLIQKPFQFMQPDLFLVMSKQKDVGGSLILSSLIGLQFCQITKNREILFVLISMLTVLTTVFFTANYIPLVLNINHYVLLSLGYIVGKLEYNKIGYSSEELETSGTTKALLPRARK